VSLLVAPGVGLAAETDLSGAQITEEDRARLVKLLNDTEARFFSLLAGVSDSQWNWKPAPERWSVGECAEHIVRSNEALFGAAKVALAGEPNSEWKEKTQGKAELLMQVMPNRNPGGAGGASAPQEIRPSGEIGRGELIARFTALYDELEERVTSSEEPMKAHTEEHPFPIFGTLSAYDWIIYVPLHTTRHSKQMVEVMETDGYPSE